MQTYVVLTHNINTVPNATPNLPLTLHLFLAMMCASELADNSTSLELTLFGLL